MISMTKIFFIAIILVTSTFVNILLPQELTAANEPKSSSAEPVEIIANGQAYPSLKDYEQWKATEVVTREAKVLAALQATAVLVAKYNNSPAKAIIPEAAAAAKIPQPVQGSDKLRTSFDENGWKTVWVKPPASTSSVPETLKAESVKPPSIDIKPSLSSVSAPKPQDEMVVSRVLGVYPSMTELVRDFEKSASSSRRGATPVTVVREDELIGRLQAQAAGETGPFLILSGHGRVRLMGLRKEKPMADKGLEEDVLPNPKLR